MALNEHDAARRELEYVRAHSTEFEADAVLAFIAKKEAAMKGADGRQASAMQTRRDTGTK